MADKALTASKALRIPPRSWLENRRNWQIIGEFILGLDDDGNPIRECIPPEDICSIGEPEGKVLKSDGDDRAKWEYIDEDDLPDGGGGGPPIIGFAAGQAGSVLSSGVEGWVRIDVACTLKEWYLAVKPSGSVTIDVWKSTFGGFPPTDADSITNGHEPSVSSASTAYDTDLTDWSNTSINASDVIMFHVDSVTTVEQLSLEFVTE